MLHVKLELPTARNCFLVPLTQGKVAIVNLFGAAKVWSYRWRAVKWHRNWYAISTRKLDGTKCRVSMHRLISETPPREVCHHLNKNTLDNRRINLLNVRQVDHLDFHGISRFAPMIRKKTR